MKIKVSVSIAVYQRGRLTRVQVFDIKVIKVKNSFQTSSSQVVKGVEVMKSLESILAKY